MSHFDCKNCADGTHDRPVSNACALLALATGIGLALAFFLIAIAR